MRERMWHMIKKMMRKIILFCLAAMVLLSGCAAKSAGDLSKKYGNPGERRMLTADGKKTDEVVITAGEYENLGDSSLKRGDISTAFINYTRALQMEPGRLSASYKTGRLFLLKGMTGEARIEFEKMIKKDPKDARAHEALGRAYLLDGDNEQAIKHFTTVLGINERLWETHNLLGIAYDRQKKFNLAVDHYKRAISIKPEAGVVYGNLGVSYYLNEKYGKARDAFVTAIEKGEDGSRVYNNLAVTLAKLGKYRAAYKALKKAGSDATAQNNIGYLYLLDGKNKEAVLAFEKAIELNPAFYAKAHENLKAAKAALQE